MGAQKYNNYLGIQVVFEKNFQKKRESASDPRFLKDLGFYFCWSNWKSIAYHPGAKPSFRWLDTTSRNGCTPFSSAI